MPARVKSNKISFSDLETPKEVEKVTSNRAKMKQVQGFSDLYPIVEEQSKSKLTSRKIEIANETQFKTEKKAKKSTITKQIHNSIGKYKFGCSKTSFEKIYTYKIDKNNGGNLINFKNSMSSKNKLIVTKDCKSMTLSKIKHENQHSLNNASKPPNLQIQTTKDSKRVWNQFNNPYQRGNKNNTKNTRRNRKERMKSANNLKRIDTSQTIPKTTKFEMRQTNGRVMPKIWKTSTELSKANNDLNIGKTKIQKMLNQIDSLDKNESNYNFKNQNKKVGIG